MSSFITIVIPVLNQRERLQACLEALQHQEGYTPSQLEIIVVDNGSVDGSDDVALAFGVRLLYSTEIKNPYYCRNLGMRMATAEYIVLLDAKCLPNAGMLRAGMKKLMQTDCPLVAGCVQMRFSDIPTIWEYLYAWRFYPNHRSVQMRMGVPTGILFLERSLLSKIGYFYTGSRGGADIEWSQRVWEAGMKIGYAARAKVEYTVPDRTGLYKKIKREGISYRNISRHRYQNHLPIQWIFGLWRYLLPARPFKLQKRIRTDFGKNTPMLQQFWRLWLLHWGSKLALLYWIIRGRE